MSHKQDTKYLMKKYKQAGKREARKQVGEGLEALGKLIYARPRYVPKFLFILLFVPAFTPRALRILWKHL